MTVTSAWFHCKTQAAASFRFAVSLELCDLRNKKVRVYMNLLARCSALLAVTAAIVLIACPAWADYVYVSDDLNNRIEKYDSVTGSHLGTFASNGLSGPNGMAFDRSGNMYVANYNSNSGTTVEKLAPDGTDMGIFASGLVAPSALALDTHGNLYVGNYPTGTIQKFGPNGENLGLFAAGSGNVNALATDGSGHIYAGYWRSGSGDDIREYDSSGSLIATLATGMEDGVFGLTFDRQGDLYAASLGGSIVEFDPAGHNLGVFANASYYEPGGMAFDSSGNLYVADYYYGNIVERFDPTGKSRETFATGLGRPSCIAIQPVPEPATLALVALGGMAMLRRRK